MPGAASDMALGVSDHRLQSVGGGDSNSRRWWGRVAHAGGQGPSRKSRDARHCLPHQHVARESMLNASRKTFKCTSDVLQVCTFSSPRSAKDRGGADRDRRSRVEAAARVSASRTATSGCPRTRLNVSIATSTGARPTPRAGGACWCAACSSMMSPAIARAARRRGWSPPIARRAECRPGVRVVDRCRQHDDELCPAASASARVSGVFRGQRRPTSSTGPGARTQPPGHQHYPRPTAAAVDVHRWLSPSARSRCTRCIITTPRSGSRCWCRIHGGIAGDVCRLPQSVTNRHVRWSLGGVARRIVAGRARTLVAEQLERLQRVLAADAPPGAGSRAR